MGIVYEAEQISLGRRVALKVLPFAAVLDPRQLQRFLNEARAAASLKHPHIVTVFSVGCERAVHFYAMDYVEGKTLAQIIDALRKPTPGLPSPPETINLSATDLLAGKSTPREPFSQSDDPAAEFVAPSLEDTRRDLQAALTTQGSMGDQEFFRSVARLGIQAAEALEHAHQMGVVHRDIKPSNLMVDTRGHLWVTDFGLAITQASPSVTMTGDLVGTLRYMSPEQIQGNRQILDHRSDIYSLGATLYELLTLVPAFPGEGYAKLMRTITEDEPRALSQYNRSIPPDLETIVLKALAKEPQHRYATAQELADDVKRFLANEPIRAKRTRLLVRLGKWTKRHKTVASVAAAVLVAVTILGTVTAVQAHQRNIRLTATATEGLADVRVAMVQQEFSQAQQRATEIQVALAEAPQVMAQFGPQLENLLHQAETRLQLQRYQQLAEEARFSANRLLLQWWAHDPVEARRRCQEALAVFHILDNERWLEELEQVSLEPAEMVGVKQSLVEILFLLASVEVRCSEDTAGVRRGVALLNQAEALAPNLRVLYESRSQYQTVLGDQEAARSDMQRAAVLQCNTWLDHYFRAIGLRDAKFGEALREIETAMTFRVDDYWSWFVWSELQGRLGANDLYQWGINICLRLRPEEASAWILHGQSGTDSQESIADLSRALELTNDPVLREIAYLQRAGQWLGLGQPEAALADCNSAIRLALEKCGPYSVRATCYQALGQMDKALADARKVLELTDVPSKGYWDYRMRIETYWFLGQPQPAADEALTLFNNEGLRDWFLAFERNIESAKDPRGAFTLAMVRCQVGEKDEARRWYDKGLQWIDKDQPEDQKLLLFRDEATTLLGVTPPAVESAPAPPAKVEEAQESPKSAPAPEAPKAEEKPQ
jgi:serine/threonine protein kinase